ncbi:protein Smaug homolog 2-like [Athene noctua]|uniref:protein Smaug homolog 2-like n=1 Tax=Athene noctua TaxID=126797 RepID=UPI003EBE24DC
MRRSQRHRRRGSSPGGGRPIGCSAASHSVRINSSPQALLALPQERPLPGTDLEISPTPESLFSMVEQVLGDGSDKTSPSDGAAPPPQIGGSPA